MVSLNNFLQYYILVLFKNDTQIGLLCYDVFHEKYITKFLPQPILFIEIDRVNLYLFARTSDRLYRTNFNDFLADPDLNFIFREFRIFTELLNFVYSEKLNRIYVLA